MRKQKIRFIPLIAALAIVLCGTWALAAGGVFEAPVQLPQEAVVPLAGQPETPLEAEDDDIDETAYLTAARLEAAMSELVRAAAELDKITLAAQGTDFYSWMCSGDTVGAGIDAINELVERRAEICESVRPSRSMVEYWQRTCDTPEYVSFINSGVASLRACVYLEDIAARMQDAFAGYDVYSCSARYEGDFKLTGYCGCAVCCGAYSNGDGPAYTACGSIAAQGRTIAMNSNYDFGTVVYVDGLGLRTVEDRGGAINGNKIDVYMENHADCMSRACNRTAPTYIVEFSAEQ